MKTIVIAQGERFEREAARFTEKYPDTILVTLQTPNICTDYDNEYFNGLTTKSGFGKFLPDTDDPIVLADADLIPLAGDALSSLNPNPSADFAFVPYVGTLHVPEVDLSVALSTMPWINSGFMWFRNSAIAKAVSLAWEAEYKERIVRHLAGNTAVHPNDEFALVIAASKLDYSFETLPPKWNVWRTELVPDNLPEDTLFYQHHLGELPDPVEDARIFEQEKDAKKAEIATARYAEEMGGFNLPAEQGGMFVRTDARNRTLLNAASVRAASDPAYEVPNWKTAEGTFVTLSNAMILLLNGAVEQFIAGCFAKEKALNDSIAATTTVQAINAITW